MLIWMHIHSFVGVMAQEIPIISAFLSYVPFMKNWFVSTIVHILKVCILQVHGIAYYIIILS